jgi:protein-S-isoprenylcysteine O-methyltransferase Ste14
MTADFRGEAPSETGNGKDTAGVIARPPVICLAFLLAGLALEFAWPAAAFPNLVRYPAGAALIALGVGIMAAALRLLRDAGTPHETDEPTTAIVRGRLYRLSRNPIYVSLILVYAGIGIAAGSLWVLGLLLPLIAVIRYGVIAREERYLERKFGEEYLRYKASARRWL